jgi:hypothetical protein
VILLGLTSTAASALPEFGQHDTEVGETAEEQSATQLGNWQLVVELDRQPHSGQRELVGDVGRDPDRDLSVLVGRWWPWLGVDAGEFVGHSTSTTGVQGGTPAAIPVIHTR